MALRDAGCEMNEAFGCGRHWCLGEGCSESGRCDVAGIEEDVREPLYVTGPG